MEGDPQHPQGPQLFFKPGARFGGLRFRVFGLEYRAYYHYLRFGGVILSLNFKYVEVLKCRKFGDMVSLYGLRV